MISPVTSTRNGLPEIPYYRWRARTYPRAQAAISHAEAAHGEPYPVCLFCGGFVSFSRYRPAGSCNGTCTACGQRTPTIDNVNRED